MEATDDTVINDPGCEVLSKKAIKMVAEEFLRGMARSAEETSWGLVVLGAATALGYLQQALVVDEEALLEAYQDGQKLGAMTHGTE